MKRRRIGRWILAGASIVGLLLSVEGPTAEAASGAMPVLGDGVVASEEGPDEDDGPSPNCPVEAGADSGTKKPNGQHCVRPTECESGFCSKLNSHGGRDGECAPCNGTRVIPDTEHGTHNNPYTADGVHNIIQCRHPTAGVLCSTSHHRPCLGSHRHVWYESCVGGTPSRPKKGVICNGLAPVPRPSDDCSTPPAPGIAWVDCKFSDQGPNASGLFEEPSKDRVDPQPLTF